MPALGSPSFNLISAMARIEYIKNQKNIIFAAFFKWRNGPASLKLRGIDAVVEAAVLKF